MSVVGSPFTLSDIRELARDPNISLASLRSGSGFSYPQRGWIYAAAAAYYEHGRNAEAMWASLEAELERGRGITPFKLQQAETVRVHLETFLALDRRAPEAPFLISAKTSPDAVTSWRNHLIRTPLGLIMQGPQGPIMRLLWAERALMRGRKGVVMVVAATLALAESTHGRLVGIETWHLRERGHAPKSYRAPDLRASWARLDRLLSSTEARIRRAPYV